MRRKNSKVNILKDITPEVEIVSPPKQKSDPSNVRENSKKERVDHNDRIAVHNADADFKIEFIN